MSGHSKWATIKRAKGAADAKRGAAFTRLTREIVIAAKEGGGNPEFNVRLRLAVDKAKAGNMPKDNIERAITHATGSSDDGTIIEEVTYEVYLPHKVAALVQVVTDNRNRSVADVRKLVTRLGGQFDGAAVAWQFSRKGVLVIEKATGAKFDEVFEVALEAGAEDIIDHDEAIEISTEPDTYRAVRDALLAKKYALASAELAMVPNSFAELDNEKAEQVLGVVDQLEELDDVQNVYHNLQAPA
jgi:YebC/PmpR family DNA-binding regulatory protein